MPALALCALLLAEGRWRAHRRRARLVSDLSRLPNPVPPWPGVPAACGVVGLSLILMVCYQLVATSNAATASLLTDRTVAGAQAAAVGICACTILAQVGRRWNVILAYISLGLLTLAVCTFATVFVPDQPHDLNRRYPALFTAIILALGLMTWFWGWLAHVWQQQRDEPSGRPGADPGAGADPGDPAWTTAGRLVPVNRRFALLAAVTGLVLAGTMSLWPILRTVSTDDDSPRRLVAALAAHVLLLLASARCARWSQRFAFHLVGVLVILSMVAFVVVRAPTA